MKQTIFRLTLVLFVFISAFSCSNKPERSRKPVSIISVEPQKKNYRFGEEVTVQVKTKLRNGEIQNIKLLYNGELIKESSELDFTVSGVKLNKLGTVSFSAVATKTDDVENTRNQSITVLSDTEAQKYTYKTVESYPHNTTFYTQGLEYYQGFLYEGTGENGKSGLFKTNLSDGKILNSYFLPEKYFGEGITIFNDRIYQLTYHAQKGFVYNLSDFALVDSFQYRQKQGWGLTNDGKHLIMSDGTNMLTWLNPDDYSVVKTLQVANNRGVVGNLNELEFINGSLFANVYTTDLLVEIEPETGKVISEINLSGIVNMFRKPNEKIDYLNGIAWDAEKNRMFVTGKWWPQIFQIELVPESK
ncbi:MAG TPA: glutaminyl-peptide cyclotransferase [Prolixibacteraceae bacterium]|nr:glutaminyl-peptide cyclotransferase [Prolixibacteraceae bacterium]